MTQFDSILPRLAAIFQRHSEKLTDLLPILVNRDLNGRVRLIVDQQWETDEANRAVLDLIAKEISTTLHPHAYPAERTLLFEPDIGLSIEQERTFPLEGCPEIRVVDRLAVEGDWMTFTPLSPTSRIVFYSIKGGVGRSTALAATAWALAEQGKRVLVLDLDLESPGLSSSLLPDDRRPVYGITDWLVEDLVENGAVIEDDMVALSDLSRNGEIRVVPAHGKNPGEYVAKLGRVWMPKLDGDGHRESWSQRLRRLLDVLERRWQPDVVLIDSQSGIDEVASACLSELGASLILLFAIDGDQTWTGYQALFRHWRKGGSVRDIRDRLQVVGAMIPETGAQDYFDGLQERAWDVFREDLYDFDLADKTAPHYPWAIRWTRSFAALRSLHGRLHGIDPIEVQSVFGPLIDGISQLIQDDTNGHS